MENFRDCYRYTCILLILTILQPGLCSPTLSAQDRDEAPLFQLLTPEESGITFSNHVIESDTFFMNVFIYAYNGGGVAIGDISGDGLPDIYFSGTQADSPSRLYLNKGGLQFEDISTSAGLLDSTGVRFGVSMVDIDGDGDLDIYACRQNAANSLYINNGDLTFTDKAHQFGLDYCCSSTQGSFFDYDRDGDLDLYLGINGGASEQQPMVKGLPDKFFRNDNGTFVDVTAETGIHDLGYALSVSVGDVNEDGWPDIYVSNDFSIRDLLYINNGNGTFTDKMEELMRHTSTSSMGSDIADFNNDGLLDIIGLDMTPREHWRKMSNVASLSTFSPVFDSTQLMRNTLFMNRGQGYFSDISELAGLSETDWSWGPLIADFDNDGFKDIFITNGFKRDVQNLDVVEYFDPHHSPLNMLQKVPELHTPNYAFRNNGDLTFRDVSRKWNADHVVNSNGIAFGDLDRDGDLDLVINNLDSTAFVLKNNAVEQHRGSWLQVELENPGKNRSLVGTRVYVRQNGEPTQTQMQELIPVRSYLSSMEYLLHFGLGNVERIDEVEVRWPDGARQILTDLPVNQRLTLRRQDAREDPTTGAKTLSTTFNGIGLKPRLPFRHIENRVNDFYRERLIPRRFSINGPGTAVGDINNDGLEDLWVGQGQLVAGEIFIQQRNGQFLLSEDQQDLQLDSLYEDTGGIFFDADNDGDLDLYVVSGGDEVEPDHPLLQDRLYHNNGKGKFARAKDALPQMLTSSSSVIAADYDQDGDADLFVAGRVIPGLYAEAPRSYLLQNQGGTFTDVTSTVAPELLNPGMVSSALWTDYDNDGDPDLMIVGEWMTPRLYRNQGGRFSDITHESGLEGHEGWWNSLTGADIDNDGDIDYLAGNLGLNTKPELTSSNQYPLRLYINDFDGNGSRDFVISYYFRGKEYPNRNKTDLARQMGTYIKRKFPSFAAFARATIPEIFSEEKLQSATVLSAHTFASLCFMNNGDGTFSSMPLPAEAQLSPVHGMIVEDFDGDNNPDLLLTQNFYGPDGTVVRYDAGVGQLLRGLGNGHFESIPLNSSGFLVSCDARSMARIRIGTTDSLCIFSTCNNGNSITHTWNLPGTKVLPIATNEKATHAILTMNDGRKERREIYAGSGYLSQNGQSLVLSPTVKTVEVYRGKNLIRRITP